MKKLYINVLPLLKIRWYSIDLRKWYYVWTDDYFCPWWACENELEELKEDYEEHGHKIIFKKIHWWKTLIR